MVYFETDSKEAVNDFAGNLMEVLKEVSDMYPLHPMTQAEKAEITTEEQMCYLDEILGESKLFTEKECRVFVRYDSELCASPLFRTIIVKPIKREALISAIYPFRSYLQSVGLACGKEDRGDIDHRACRRSTDQPQDLL